VGSPLGEDIAGDDKDFIGHRLFNELPCVLSGGFRKDVEGALSLATLYLSFSPS